MSRRVPGLGEVRAVTGVTGVTFVFVSWPRGSYGHSPAAARDLATALLAVADEAEAIDAAAAVKAAAKAAGPVQDELFEAV